MGYRAVWTEEATKWFNGLTRDDAEKFTPALDALARRGASAGKEHVKPIKTSRHREMQELRSSGGNLRVLFAMEGNTAVMLLGGDKTGEWNHWYERNVRVADDRLDRRRRTTGKEPLCRSTRAGTRSAAREA